jgi:hypothetical protein
MRADFIPPSVLFNHRVDRHPGLLEKEPQRRYDHGIITAVVRKINAMFHFPSHGPVAGYTLSAVRVVTARVDRAKGRQPRYQRISGQGGYDMAEHHVEIGFVPE